MHISQNALLFKTYMNSTFTYVNYSAAIRFVNISYEYNILTQFYKLFERIIKTEKMFLQNVVTIATGYPACQQNLL